MKLYHFTCIEHVDSILNELKIRTTDANLTLDEERPVVLTVGIDGYLGNKNPVLDAQVVWLTDKPTADHKVQGWAVWTTATDKTRVRITVEVPDAQLWSTWWPKQPHNPKMIEGLKKTGGDWRMWWVLERDVEAEEIIEMVDVRTGRVLYDKAGTVVTRDTVESATVIADALGVTGPTTIWAFSTYKQAIQHTIDITKQRIVELGGDPDKVFNKQADEGIDISHEVLPYQYDWRDELFVWSTAIDVQFADRHRDVIALNFKFKESAGCAVSSEIDVVSLSDRSIHKRLRDKFSVETFDVPDVVDENNKISSDHMIFMYIMGRRFLASHCAYQEPRNPVREKKRDRATKPSPTTISVAIYRRPERIWKKAMKKAFARRYNFRFDVSGHFRMQWYPSVQQHRRIFIRSFEKGPKDAPKDPRRKVLKAVR